VGVRQGDVQRTMANQHRLGSAKSSVRIFYSALCRQHPPHAGSFPAEFRRNRNLHSPRVAQAGPVLTLLALQSCGGDKNIVFQCVRAVFNQTHKLFPESMKMRDSLKMGATRCKAYSHANIMVKTDFSLLLYSASYPRSSLIQRLLRKQKCVFEVVRVGFFCKLRNAQRLSKLRNVRF
jgi:hypothetical protein